MHRPFWKRSQTVRDDERAWTKKATGPSGDVESENRRECRDANHGMSILYDLSPIIIKNV